MKISKELVIGLVLTVISAYYWSVIGNSISVNDVPLFYRFTYRLYPYLDFVITVIGMLFFYRGLMKLRG